MMPNPGHCSCPPGSCKSLGQGCADVDVYVCRRFSARTRAPERRAPERRAPERRANSNYLTVPRAHSQMKRLRRVAQIKYFVFVGFWARPKSVAIFLKPILSSTVTGSALAHGRGNSAKGRCARAPPSSAHTPREAHSPPPEDAGSGRPTSLRQRRTGGGRERAVMVISNPARCMHELHAPGTWGGP